MKKIFIGLFLISIFSFSVFAQANDSTNYRGQRVQPDNKACALSKAEGFNRDDTSSEVNLYFSSPVDPKTLSGENITINGKAMAKTLKITFNREGTQARFVVTGVLPFELKLTGVKSVTGKAVPDVSVKVKDSSGQYK